MGQMISFKRPDGQGVQGYLAEPAAGAKAPGLVVIQEWWGLNAQIKGVADRMAAAGYRALVPDLYRGKVAVEANEAEHLMTNLNFGDAAGQDVRGAVQHLKGTSAKVGVTGFCMGGALTLLSVANVPEVDAGVCWYGFPPLEYIDATKIKAPLLAHFAIDDVPFPIATVDKLEEKLRAAERQVRVPPLPGAARLRQRDRRRQEQTPDHRAQPGGGGARVEADDGVLRQAPEVTGRVAAAALAAMLEDGGELALLDVREEGVFAKGHLFRAVSVPLSRLELKVARLVPRRSTRIVLCDDDDGLAERAARSSRQFGYTNVAVLAGGVDAWRALGRELFAGVYVPSKAFGEHVEHHDGTPSISRGGAGGEARRGREDGRARQPAAHRVPADEPAGRARLPGCRARPPDLRGRARSGHAGRRELRRPHALDHRRAVAAQRRRAAPRGRASQRHDGLDARRARSSSTASARWRRRPARRRSRRRVPRRGAVAARFGVRDATDGNCANGSATASGRSTCSTSARPRSTSPAICRRPRARPAASSCSRPTRTSAPAMRASCSSTPTACAPR